jgi:hypothetical protein
MLRKLLPFVLFMLPSAAFSQTATVTGHLLNPDSSVAPNSKLCVSLQNFKPNVPRIATGVVVNPTGWCVVPTAGLIPTALFQNSAITPAGTYWRFDFYLNGQQQSSASAVSRQD